jgi:hypothetical protein
MKNFICIALFSAGIFLVKDVEAQLSFTAQHNYLNAAEFDQMVRDYNLAHAWQEDKLPLLTHGIALQVGWMKRISAVKSVYLHPIAQVSQYTVNAKNEGGNYQIRLREADVRVDLNFSLKGIFGNVSTGPLGTRWYLYISPALSIWQAQSFNAGEVYTPNELNNKRRINLAPSAAIGTGYRALMLAGKIAVTPKFGFRWYPLLHIDHMAETVQGANVSGLKNEAKNVSVWESGIEFTWIFPRKKSGKGLAKPCPSC